MRLHVSSTCAYRQKVKIVLYGLWYHQNIWHLVFVNSAIFCRLHVTTHCHVLSVITPHLRRSESSIVPLFYCHVCANRFRSVTGRPEWQANKTLIFLCTKTKSCQVLPLSLFLHVLSTCMLQLRPLQPFVLTVYGTEVTICTTRLTPKILHCSEQILLVFLNDCCSNQRLLSCIALTDWCL